MAKTKVNSPFTDVFPSKGLDNMQGLDNEKSNPTMPSPGKTGSFPVSFGDDMQKKPATERTPFQDALNQQMHQPTSATFKKSPLTTPFEDALAKTFKK